MKTFLKLLLLLLIAIVALKLLPFIFSLGCWMAGALLALLAMGVSAIAVLTGGAIVLVAVLAPVWVPVLAIVGVIALIKRGTRRSGAVVA